MQLLVCSVFYQSSITGIQCTQMCNLSNLAFLSYLINNFSAMSLLHLETSTVTVIKKTDCLTLGHLLLN